MKSTISYDDELQLIDSGTFLHYGFKPVTISIKEDDGTSLNIRLEFVFDKSVGDTSFKFSQLDKFTLLLKVTHNGRLVNYGYKSPVKVGSFNGHELFFNIRVNINSVEDSPVISYSWFKGKKEL